MKFCKICDDCRIWLGTNRPMSATFPAGTFERIGRNLEKTEFVLAGFEYNESDEAIESPNFCCSICERYTESKVASVFQMIEKN